VGKCKLQGVARPVKSAGLANEMIVRWRVGTGKEEESNYTGRTWEGEVSGVPR